MVRAAAAVLCVMAAWTVGCGNPEPPAQIPIQPKDPSEFLVEPVRPLSEWDRITGAETLPEPESTVFVPASEAEECPDLDVYRSDNSEFTIEPGRPGYIERGHVTILVFWKMERLAGRGAARYVSDLARKYRGLRVRAIGIVEEGVSVEAVNTFANNQGLAFPIFYDLYEALPDLRDAIGATDADRPGCAVFIIDRKLRLRFYRSNLTFAAGMLSEGAGARARYRPGMEMVGESVPPGKSVEDYLIRILKERDPVM
jgi:hypothetical protein